MVQARRAIAVLGIDAIDIRARRLGDMRVGRDTRPDRCGHGPSLARPSAGVFKSSMIETQKHEPQHRQDLLYAVGLCVIAAVVLIIVVAVLRATSQPYSGLSARNQIELVSQTGSGVTVSALLLGTVVALSFLSAEHIASARPLVAVLRSSARTGSGTKADGRRYSRQATAYICVGSGRPFNSTRPRSSKRNPLPMHSSRTATDTAMSPGRA